MSARIVREPSLDARLEALTIGQLAVQSGLPFDGVGTRAWIGYLLLAGRLFNPAVISGIRWGRA